MTDNSDFDGLAFDDQSQIDVLETQAARYGEDTFLIYGPEDREVSFAELDRTANRIGNALRERGVERGETVSLLFRNPLQTLFAMYGTQKAGGIYAPINFEYKGRTLSYQLNDLDSDVLLLEDQYVDRLNFVADDLETHPEVVVLETDADGESLDGAFSRSSFADLLDSDPDAPDVDVAWHDPASIIYTSGTTGKPKGCLLPHRWPTYFTRARRAVMNREDTIHSVVPMYHVVGPYWDTTTSLMTGGRVALWDRFSSSDFWDRVERYEATNTTLISVMQSWLMNQPAEPDDHRNTLNKVQMAPLPENHVAMCRRFGWDVLTCQYGQTECGNPVTGVISPIEDKPGTPDDIRRGKEPADVLAVAEALDIPVLDEAPAERFMGNAMPLLEASVHDEHDEEVPPGEVGEFVVRPKRPGTILKEYYGAPEKTVEGWRNLWWHTGDAVYRDEEGYFYFVDRMGDVIRRRGENVSSMQIQQTINEHDAVAETAVFPVPAEEGGEDEIVAIVQPKAGQTVTSEAVLEYLEPRLPEFMVPRFVVVREELPTTETNKVEKYKLREQFLEGELDE